MNSEAEWRRALKASPDDKTLLLAYGDWLEEQGELVRACQAREKAGAGNLIFRLYHPTWSDGPYGEFAQIHHVKTHVNHKRRQESPDEYRRNPADDPVPVAELVVVIEWRARPAEIARRQFTRDMRL